MKHLIYSHIEDTPIAWFDKFDKEAIKQAIVKHLTDNPADEVEHCKQFNRKDIRRFYGYEIINFYRCNDKQEPCLVVPRNNKEYLKRLK